MGPWGCLGAFAQHQWAPRKHDLVARALQIKSHPHQAVQRALYICGDWVMIVHNCVVRWLGDAPKQLHLLHTLAQACLSTRKRYKLQTECWLFDTGGVRSTQQAGQRC